MPLCSCAPVPVNTRSYVLKADPSVRVHARAHKMSKSRGNVVNPDDVVTSFGADSLRLYEMFMGPLRDVKVTQLSCIDAVDVDMRTVCDIMCLHDRKVLDSRRLGCWLASRCASLRAAGVMPEHLLCWRGICCGLSGHASRSWLQQATSKLRRTHTCQLCLGPGTLHNVTLFVSCYSCGNTGVEHARCGGRAPLLGARVARV